MDAEQAFWLRISSPTSTSSDASIVIIKSTKELPKVSLVNESLKKIKFHVAKFDNVVKIRTTPDARTEGKSKNSSHQPKAKDTNQEKLYLLHMDLCGPMRMTSINGKRYILVIVDDYSRFTWVRFLRTKDEAPEAIIKCIKNIQVRLNATVFHVATEPRAIDLADSPVSTSIEQDAPSASIPSTQKHEHYPIISQGVEESPKTQTFHDDPLNESLHEDSTSQGSSSNVLQLHTPFENLGKTFTIIGNSCPLTRITSANVVPPKIATSYSVESQKPELKVYSRKLKNVTNIGSSKKVNTVESKNANHSEPNHIWGSNATNITSSASLVMTGLVPNTVFQQPYIPPNRDDWDHLLQPMFDEYFNPSTFFVSLVHVAAEPRAIDLADSPVSTSIEQDAPSASIPSTQKHKHYPIISQGVEESPKTQTFHDDPLNESLHEDSTSQGSSSNVLQLHTPFENLGR
nr:hypothetical protein [Tanacetum cinerariifolium]